MMTKAEYQQWIDPEMNNYWGIRDLITSNQDAGRPDITFATRIIVPKKVYDELRKLPWDFTVTTDDTGLPSSQRGIIKIAWI